MSALGLDDRHNAGGISSYAPRRGRRSDSESTIRPVLERLSRGEGREPDPRLVQRAVVHHLPPPDVETVAKSSVPMIARLSIAAGVLAAATAGVVMFVPHNAPAPTPVLSDAAPPSVAAAPKVDMAAPASLPKTVQTLAIHKSDQAALPPAAVIKDDARVPEAPASTANVDPVAAPVTLWTMMPADLPQPSSLPIAAEATNETPPQPAAAQPATTPPHKIVGSHHTRHVVRHSRHHTRQVAHAAPAQPAAEAEPTQSQPIKKLPLQEAIDRLVGGSSAASAPSPRQ
jgi:hypothetical protein